MASSILAPGVSEAVSGEVEVLDSTGTVVSLYTDNGDPIPADVVLFLERKSITDNFERVATIDYGFIKLKRDCNVIAITTPGTYRIYRPDISNFFVNVGVQIG